MHLFIKVFVPILYFFIHFRPTELDALVFGHLYSVLTGYLSDNSLSSVVRANKNLDNFGRENIERILSVTNQGSAICLAHKYFSRPFVP